ncbi:MAG TPA: YihY/virulence factor BrkB family protein [Sphingomonas sp.]|jgi:membrane protein|nr:YihY/virulence factor BrkB family protein [Sphingomonas sp.]
MTPRSPFAVPAGGWMAVLKRTWSEVGEDNVSLIAAGTAFYVFAAIVPLLGAIVLSYGLFADTQTVDANIRALFGVLPRDAASLIGDQLATVVRSSGKAKGWGLIVALALAIYGASKGASSVITALNIAYEEKETRGFVALTALSLAMVVGAMLVAMAAIASTAAMAFLEGLMPGAPAPVLTLVRIGGYLVTAVLAALAAAVLYRFGPDHRKPRWAWLSPGSLLATTLWLIGTIGFGIYVANFGNYGATYGSLSAVIVLLTWLWLSAYVFLIGAELNSELERQVDLRGPVAAPSPPHPTPAARLPVTAVASTVAAAFALGRLRWRTLATLGLLAGVAAKRRR